MRAPVGGRRESGAAPPPVSSAWAFPDRRGRGRTGASRANAAAPRQPGGSGEGSALSRLGPPPLPPPSDEEGRPPGSGRAAAIRALGGTRLRPSHRLWLSHRHRCQEEVLAGKPPRRGNPGVRGRAKPSPEQIAPPVSPRTGRGGRGVRAVPAGPTTRCGSRFRPDTCPCRGRGENMARREPRSPGAPICRGAAASRWRPRRVRLRQEKRSGIRALAPLRPAGTAAPPSSPRCGPAPRASGRCWRRGFRRCGPRSPACRRSPGRSAPRPAAGGRRARAG